MTKPFHRSTLKLWPTNTCLVSELVTELCTKTREQIKNTIVLVPTLRLTQFIRAELAQHFGALIPPQLATIESFVHKEADVTIEHHEVLGPELGESLLRELVSKADYVHLKPGHEHELLQLFEEIISEEIESDCLAKLAETIATDVYRSTDHQGSLLLRAEEIRNLFQLWTKLLADNALETPAQSLRRKSNFLCANLRQEEKQFYLVGFTSLSPALLRFTNQIVQNSPSQVWLSHSPALLAQANPLNDLVNQLACETTVPLPKREGVRQIFEKFAAPDTRSEVLGAAERINQLIASGYSPREIGLVVTSDRVYGPLVHFFAEALNAPLNLALPITLAETRLGSWLYALSRHLRKPKESQHLQRFLLHPLTIELLKQASDLDDTAVQEVIASALTQKFALRKLSSLETKEPTLKKAFTRLNDLLGKLKQKDTRAETLLEMTSQFEDADDPYFSASFEALENFLENSAKLSKIVEINFWQSFRQILRSVKVHLKGEPLAGVQILSLAEARYYPFKALILVGCNEGLLPINAVQDDLLDDYLKRKMGLSGWASLEAREELSFKLFKARIPHLATFYCERRLGQDLSASNYLADMPMRELPARSTGKYPPNKELAQDLEGQFPSFTPKEMSATSLTRFIHCPYQFLLADSGVRELELASEELDLQMQGERLHQILEEYFQNPLDSSKDSFVGQSNQRLAELTDLHLPESEFGFADRYHLKTFSWPKLSEWLASWNCSFSGNSEFRFSNYFAPQKVLLKGSIDRTEDLAGGQLIIDFKRKSLADPSDLKKGLVPQLFFYALGLAQPVSELVLGYWSIFEGRWQAVAVGSSLRDEAIARGLANSRTPDLANSLETILQLWRLRQEQVQEKQRYFADPSNCGLCEYEAICRKRDERYSERIENQALLAELT